VEGCSGRGCHPATHRLPCPDSLGGTVNGSEVKLTLMAPGFQNMTVNGTISGTTMTGTLSGNGFVAAQLNLTKK
jgi:hypothetical protein